MQKILIGRVQNTHGLLGNLKIQMYYPYTVDLLLNNKIFFESDFEPELKNDIFEVEKVFGVIKENCIVKFSNINSIEEAKKQKELDVFALVNKEDDYSFNFIGYEVRRDKKTVGVVKDIQWINGIEYLELNQELITIDQIKKVENQIIFL
ncbi:hypothetical protein [Alphaproteobacteria bacterium endosymbiont of Tiliacea citrago]|uniref:hypothetical protein n=1 Tax=Alphaproteobacteria bacterium endosymbiont of Tiliacea citrago TaxID=3077944 RepID=UPI00313D335C